jgi:serine/threonine protein kinase
MAYEESYDNLCHDIYMRLYSQLERKDEERYRFAPAGTAKGVLHHDILMRFFHSLLSRRRTAIDEFGLPEEDLVHRINERQLHDFLAILIFATCRTQAARIFTTRLVAGNEWPVMSSAGNKFHVLPAGREELLELFNDDLVTVYKFLTTQACFCPVMIQRREEVIVKSLEEHRLPYIAEKLLSQGSFGMVYKVKIAKGHFYDSRSETVNPDYTEIARKDYRISENAHIEHEIMGKILNSSSWECKNIVENYGSLHISPTKYSLFMPLAICDLMAYMREIRQTKPGDVIEKAKIIKSAIGLAAGLNFLHNKLKTSDEEDLVCYHMDLKPDNILIFRETSNNETNYIWKISDFGMARVKLRNRYHNSESERDFNSWFVQHKKSQDQSSLATLNRRGEGTYLAPESISAIPSMKTESDVWSLGCVISVVFTYLEEGGDGVARYQDARLKDNQADGIDRFFLRGTRFTSSKVHPIIKKWHSGLIDKAGQRDDREGRAVKFILRYLEKSVFEINQAKRDGVIAVEEALRETFRKYKELEAAREDIPEKRKRLSGSIKPLR